MSTPAESIKQALHASNNSRRLWGALFYSGCVASTSLALATLVVLIIGVAWQSGGWLDWQFLTSFDSQTPQKAGVLAGLWGSMWLILLTASITVPLGVGAALYLEEYARGTWLTRLIQLNIANLAGVPSVVYGILGLSVFVRNFGLFGSEQKLRALSVFGLFTLNIPMPFGPSVITGALTLSLLVLPTVIIATQESLRAVPSTLRHASYALGATRWQTIWNQVLPAATPGIVTGVILALSRAIGETAPLVMIGIPAYIRIAPGRITNVSELFSSRIFDVPFSKFTSLPQLIYAWIAKPQDEFRSLASAGIVVLLVLLTAMNLVAIVIRNRYQKRIRW